MLKTEIIEPGNSAYTLTTQYDYDGFGNKTRLTQSGAGVVSRTTETVYDADGRYPVSHINAYNQITDTVLWRDNAGRPTVVADINGVESVSLYTLLGYPWQQSDASGASTQTRIEACDALVAAGCAYQQREKSGVRS